MLAFARPAMPPRQALWLALILALFLALPFAFAALPQQSDFPAHLARYRVMLEGGSDPALARWYQFHWQLGGNLGVDLLMRLLGPVLGLEPAARLVGAAIPVLTGLGLIAVERALRGRVGLGAVLAMAAVWSPAMALGFANFCLSLALALFAFAGWIKLEGRRERAAVFLPAACAVWLCHMAGWGVLVVLVGGYELSRKGLLRGALACWPLLLPLVPVLAAGSAGGVSYGEGLIGYKLGIWLKAMRVHDAGLDMLLPLVLLAVVYLAERSGRVDRRLGWGALGLVLASLLLPRHLSGADYADYRLTAVALMVLALAIDWPAPRAIMLAAAAATLARVVPIALAWHGQAQQLETMLSVLDQVPQGARVAGAVDAPEAPWALNPFEHVPCYATVRRGALVNAHFVGNSFNLMELRGAPAGFADPSQRIIVPPGTRPDLAHFAPARDADYLWYIGEMEPQALPAGARLVARVPGSMLLKLASPAPAN